MQSISDRVALIFRKYKLPLKFAALAALILALFVCFSIGGRQNTGGNITYAAYPENSDELKSNYGYITPTALDSIAEMSEDVRYIDLDKEKDDLLLTESGSYCLEGELKGSIIIAVPEENVHLFLNGATVEAVYGPALYCEDADKLVITLMPGTENTISDSGHYPADSEAEACIYCTCNMTLNGEGKLNVNGLYKDAVRSKDVLKLLGGEYNIRCKRTAFHGSDGIFVNDGSYFISSEKYALKTTKKGSDGRGDLMIAGGEWSILAGRYAFVAEMADLVVYDCEIQHKSVIGLSDVGGRSLVDQECIA